MSKVLVEESSLHGVGNGIRYVNGESTTYKPSEFENAIKDLKPNLGTKTLTENGTFPASDDDLDGFSSVKVAVPPSSAVLVEKTITENGDYDPVDDDADGYSAVSVEVENSYTEQDEGKVVSSGALVSQTSRTVDENGTYDTTLNNEIVVNVPQSVDKKYYNGVLLPVLPEVSGYPYVIVQFRTDTVSVAEPYLYKAYFGKTKWYSSVPNDQYTDPTLSYRDWRLTPDANTEYLIYGYNGVNQRWTSLGSSLDSVTQDTVHTTNGQTIIWSNDNVYLDSTRTVEDEIMLGTAAVSDPPTGGDANHRYYNGVLLPILPEVSGYPYAIIQRKGTVPYMAYLGVSRWFGQTGATLEEWGLTNSLEDFNVYRYDSANDQWVFVKNSQDDMPPAKVYTTGGFRVIWSSDNIYQNSNMTAGTEIMRGTDAVVSGGVPAVPVTVNARTKAFIGQNSTISWGNTNYPKYLQIWIDLQPVEGKTLVITNTGGRDFYGFTSAQPESGLSLNSARASSGGSLTVTYDGGSDRYLVYDLSDGTADGVLTITCDGDTDRQIVFAFSQDMVDAILTISAAF